MPRGEVTMLRSRERRKSGMCANKKGLGMFAQLVNMEAWEHRIV